MQTLYSATANVDEHRNVNSMNSVNTLIARGCQRHVNCLAYSRRLDVFIFASAGDVCLAIFDDENGGARVVHTKCAHSSTITCLKFLSWSGPSTECLETCDYFVSGSSNGEVIIWKIETKVADDSQASGDCMGWEIAPIRFHDATGNQAVTCCAGTLIKSPLSICIAYCVPDSLLQVQLGSVSQSGKVVQDWHFAVADFKPSYILSIALEVIVESSLVLLAVGTTDCKVEIIAVKTSNICNISNLEINRIATLQGHEDWISSLAFKRVDDNGENEVLMLASGSQDNLIRLWSLTVAQESCVQYQNDIHHLDIQKFILLTKTDLDTVVLMVLLESILSGHDDWVRSIDWHPRLNQLLSASNDGTITIWEPSEEARGVWLDKVLVDFTFYFKLIGQFNKDAAIGFLGASYIANGNALIAHNNCGGLFCWREAKNTDDENHVDWQLEPVLSGHCNSVKDIAWDPSGSYLLSCSFDQTTRCFAPCRTKNTIIEIARPQVHGYDLNCIASISSSCFVSGADEKISRVFTTTKNFVTTLQRISKIDLKFSAESFVPHDGVVQVPALGLSNKQSNENNSIMVERSCSANDYLTEEYLSRSTLWPEAQKLYGHGFEVYAIAAAHSGSMIATTCKASNLENASIIIWECGSWERKCELFAHKLTVVQLAFSNDDHFLLSVSRDRTFSIFQMKDASKPFDWCLMISSAQIGDAHSRIIWTCAWSADDRLFATGSRDKKLCVWQMEKNMSVENRCSVSRVLTHIFKNAVTAVDFLPEISQRLYVVAIGQENGDIELIGVSEDSDGFVIKFNLVVFKKFTFSPKDRQFSAAVTRLRFRPGKGAWLGSGDEEVFELASASDDNAVCVFQISLMDIYAASGVQLATEMSSN